MAGKASCECLIWCLRLHTSILTDQRKPIKTTDGRARTRIRIRQSLGMTIRIDIDITLKIRWDDNGFKNSSQRMYITTRHF